MNVLLLSRYDRLGASSRVRLYQYVPYLKAHGIQVIVAPLLDNAYIEDLYAGRNKCFSRIFVSYLRRLWYLLKSRRFDLLWIEKELLPWLPALGETLLARTGIPYAVDYDDAVFHLYDQHPNALVRTFLGRKIDRVMRRATLVIVGNDYLADRARRAGAQWVEYLPTAVDLDRYALLPQHKKGTFTIGWIGSPITAKYLYLVQAVLAELCQKYELKVTAVGFPVTLTLKGVSLETRTWSEAGEVGDICTFDIGIMPLPDDPFERGKCGYKLIQYMACGLPVVASPVGVNREIVDDGVNGFVATTEEEWIKSLSALHNDAKLRARMGIAGREKVEAKYCLHVTAPKLASLFYAVTGLQTLQTD